MSLNDQLAEFCRSHGLQVETDGRWLCVPGHETVLRGESTLHEQDDGNVLVQLDVLVGLVDGRLLVESCAGAGGDREEAERDAVHGFANYTLHVLMSAFFGCDVGEQVAVGKARIDGATWRLVSSHVVPRTSQDLEFAPPPELAATIHELIHTRSVSGAGRHWLRVFYAQLDGEPQMVEVLWDNEDWPEAREAIGQLEWTGSPGFASARLFMVLQDDAMTDANRVAEANRRDFCWLEAGVRILVDSCYCDPEIEDEALRELLIERGYDVRLAGRLVAFAPLGFSSVFLAHSGIAFPERCQVMEADGTGAMKPLRGEPVFGVAEAVALDLVVDEATHAHAFNVAARCSVTHAVRQALEQGARAEHMECSPPMVYLDGARSTGVPDLVLTTRAADTDVQPASDQRGHFIAVGAVSPLKRWWQFWK